MDASGKAQTALNVVNMASTAVEAQVPGTPDVLMADSDARPQNVMQDIDVNGPVPLTSSVMDDASLKRRHPDNNSTQSDDPQPGEPKKLKLDSSSQMPQSVQQTIASVGRVTLSPEIWHRVFVFCPPKTLGNLLRVSKLFNLYLDPSSSVKVDKIPPSSPGSVVKALKPNAIWKESRRFFWPYIPAPLKDKTELEMWRLTCSSTCQFCGKKDTRSPLPPLRDGPGKDGVSCIWTFRVRCCGTCLSNRSIKEMDFFMSNVPSFLTSALPFVFSTEDYHIVSAALMEKGKFPANMSLSKLFWSADVHGLHQEFLSAKELGASAAEEWQKGLELRGKQRKADAAKWEKFAESGGLGDIQTTLYPSYQVGIAAAEASKARQASPLVDQAPFPAASLPPRLLPSSSQKPASNAELVASSGQPSSLSAKVAGLSHPGRTRYEIAELKRIRRADILRRANSLDPPLTEDMLEKMTAFRTAMQLVTPLTDSAWATLKPRLLEQRAQMERKKPVEVPKATSSQPRSQPKPQAQVQTKSKSQPQSQPQVRTQNSSQSNSGTGNASVNPKQVKMPIEVRDKTQALRSKIISFADEAIRNWKYQHQLTGSSASDFAVNVLVYVRKRFYDQVEKEAKKARSEGRKPAVDPPNGPFTQKLTLENMKYIFDMRIHHLTDHLRKDMFLCNGCNNGKLYQLQGVLQHYAIKHSRALTVDKNSVNWNAEWPSTHPFKLNTASAKKASVSSEIYRSSAPLPNASAPPPTRTRKTSRSLPSSHSAVASTPRGSGIDTDLGPRHDAMYFNTRAVMANVGSDLWRAVSREVFDFVPPVKIFTVLYHLNKFHHMTFGHPLPIGLFIDGLLREDSLEPMRNAGNMFCNACEQQGQQDQIRFTLPELLRHFLAVHINYPPLGHGHDETRVDWITGMIDPQVENIINSIQGRDGQGCLLIGEAVQNRWARNFKGALTQNPSISQPSDVHGQGHRQDMASDTGTSRNGVRSSQNTGVLRRTGNIAPGCDRWPSGDRAAKEDPRRDPHATEARCKTEEREMRAVRNMPHAPLNREERPNVSSARDTSMRPPRQSRHRSPPRASSRPRLEPSRQEWYMDERGRGMARQENLPPPREAGRSASLFADGGGGRGGMPEHRSGRSRSPFYGRPAESAPPPPIVYRNPSPPSRVYDHTRMVGPTHMLPENSSVSSYGGTAPPLPSALPPATASQMHAQQYYRVYVNEEQAARPASSAPSAQAVQPARPALQALPAPPMSYPYGAASNSSGYYGYAPAPPAPMAAIDPPPGSFYSQGPVYGGGQGPPAPGAIRRAAAYYEEYDPRHPTVSGAAGNR